MKPSKHRLRLFSIAVNTEIQSKGIGSLMLIKFETKLIEHQVKSYGLSVKKSNINGIKFYLKNGFEEEFSSGDSVFYEKILS